jgi:hypothetical protein
MNRKIIWLLLGFFAITGNAALGQILTPAQDSLLQFLVKNQTDLKAAVSQYHWINLSLKDLLISFGIVILLIAAAWRFWFKEKLQNYLQKKAQDAINALTNLKTHGILIVSSQAGKDNGNDKFLRKFFKNKGFDNVKFHHIGDKKTELSEPFDYGVVFANNEDNLIDKAVVRQYVTEDSVLFYFGKPASWNFQNDTTELSRKINYANSRAQIHGNLLSSLEYLTCAVAKYGND